MLTLAAHCPEFVQLSDVAVHKLACSNISAGPCNPLQGHPAAEIGNCSAVLHPADYADHFLLFPSAVIAGQQLLVSSLWLVVRAPPATNHHHLSALLGFGPPPEDQLKINEIYTCFQYLHLTPPDPQSEYSWNLGPPFASKMTSKRYPKIIKIPTSVKTSFLQPLQHQTLVFLVPDTPESDPKSSKKPTSQQTPKKDTHF